MTTGTVNGKVRVQNYTALRFTGGVEVFFGFTNNFIGGAEIVLNKFGKTSFYSKSRRGS